MITFLLPEGEFERIAFAYSPLVEAFFSLDVIHEPKHHSLQHDWVRRCQRLDPRLKREIASLAYFYTPFIPSPICAYPTGGYPSFESELDRLLTLDDETIRYEFSAPFIGMADLSTGLPPRQWRTQALVRAEAAGASEIALLALDYPRQLIERLAAMLVAYWEAAFAAAWQRVESQLAASVERAGREIAASGIYGFLESLAPAVQTDRVAGRFSFDRAHEHEVEIGEDQQLVLVPSFYLWPHVRVNCERPWPYAIAYPAPFMRERAHVDMPPTDLLRLMRALAHGIRLEIVRLVAEQPRTTQELAPLLRLSDSAISKHLRQLTDAGILTASREGYYVLYRLDEERLATVAPTLSAFIRRDR